MRRSSMPCVWSAWSCVKSTPSSASARTLKQLLAQIGRGVDQHASCGRRSTDALDEAEQRRRRFFGFAGSHAPHMVPMRGTPPDEPQPRIVDAVAHAAAVSAAARAAAPCVNRRKKFSVVAAASSAGETPFTSASVAAVCTT